MISPSFIAPNDCGASRLPDGDSGRITHFGRPDRSSARTLQPEQLATMSARKNAAAETNNARDNQARIYATTRSDETGAPSTFAKMRAMRSSSMTTHPPARSSRRRP